MATFVGLCSYGSDAYTRYSRMPDSVWNVVPSSGDPPYAVRFCYLTKDTAVVRVYDITGRDVLAERMFLSWTAQGFIGHPRLSGIRMSVTGA